MAWVFKRDGSWVIKWLDGAGRYRQKRTACKTRLEAKALAHQIAIKAEYQRVGLEPIEGPSRITFNELLDWYWKNFGEVLRSKGSKFSSERHLRPTLGPLTLPEVTGARIDEVLSAARKPDGKLLSPTSLNALRAFLHTVFAKAIQRGLWKMANPVAAVPRRKIRKRLPSYLKPDEVTQVLPHVPDQWQALFACAVYTGMRRGELVALRKRDVDLKEGTITVARSWSADTTKGEKEATLPIHPELAPYLREALRRSPSELVFPRPDGSMQSENIDLQEILRNAMGRAGLVDGWILKCRRKTCRRHVESPTPDARKCAHCNFTLWPSSKLRPIRFRDLRHYTTATLLLKAGASLAVVQRIMRHSSPVITAGTYGHLDLTDMTQALSRLSFGAPVVRISENDPKPHSSRSGKTASSRTVTASGPSWIRTQGPIDYEARRVLASGGVSSDNPLVKRYFIHTFGCQMNVNDSLRMGEVLASVDYAPTPTADGADLIILNTCSIREKGEDKMLSALGRYRAVKLSRGALIGVGGCVAQQEKEKLLRKVPYVDFVFGPDAIGKLPSILSRLETERRIVETAWVDSEEYVFPQALPETSRGKVTEFVTVMKGCDNVCAFCVVPHTRGREVSRPFTEVLTEVHALAQVGLREVTLIGQNVNSYRGGVSFAELLLRVAQVPGIDRVRFTTSHPHDLSPELVEAFRTEPKLASHFHLPVQSGSDAVLKRMRRDYTVAQYLERLQALREARPGIAVTTDIIVGYPGETEEDFEGTMRLTETVRFEHQYSFIFSPRPRTTAGLKEAEWGPIPHPIKLNRLDRLQKLQRRISTETMAGLVGTQVEVLVEGASRFDPAKRFGRTGENRVVNFEGTARTGESIRVLVERSTTNALSGRQLASEPGFALGAAFSA